MRGYINDSFLFEEVWVIVVWQVQDNRWPAMPRFFVSFTPRPSEIINALDGSLPGWVVRDLNLDWHTINDLDLLFGRMEKAFVLLEGFLDRSREFLLPDASPFQTQR